ncbi:hypothetical protein QR680_004154 [Steinernema hermaphroditum]|uniref:Major sperm protein n=1 Tax=Steinernema hermaphroditum TaxID=289476 RepID=A0AA39LSR4_9BILA|nr:hypothetical protein QR680_004154 [Steinernema hermaphroditum]
MKGRSSESLRSQTGASRHLLPLIQRLPRRREVVLGICVLIAIYLAVGREARFVCHLFTCVPAALLNVWMMWNDEIAEQVNFMLLYWTIQGVLVVVDSAMNDLVGYYVAKFTFLSIMLLHGYRLSSEKYYDLPVGLNPPGSSKSSLLSETLDNLSKKALATNKSTKSSERSAASTAKTPPPNASEAKSECTTARVSTSSGSVESTSKPSATTMDLTMTLGKSTQSVKEAPKNDLITTPADTLTFALPNRQQCVLYVSNNAARRIMWAIKTNSRKRIGATPSYGILSVGGSVQIKVAVDLQDSTPSTKDDRLSIDYMFIDDVDPTVQEFSQKLFLNEKVGRERKNFVIHYE